MKKVGVSKKRREAEGMAIVQIETRPAREELESHYLYLLISNAASIKDYYISRTAHPRINKPQCSKSNESSR